MIICNSHEMQGVVCNPQHKPSKQNLHVTRPEAFYDLSSTLDFVTVGPTIWFGDPDR